jgi:phosphatidylinositol phospholipase C delta
MSIIYTCSGKYKILHLVALSSDIYELWRTTLLKLYEQRRELQMGGLDQFRKRQNIWLKQHYSKADLDNDKILDFRDVTALVKNLNISASDKDMKTNFEVDVPIVSPLFEVLIR